MLGAPANLQPAPAAEESGETQSLKGDTPQQASMCARARVCFVCVCVCVCQAGTLASIMGRKVLYGAAAATPTPAAT